MKITNDALEMLAKYQTPGYVKFDDDIVRLIRTFVNESVQKDVYARMKILEGKVRWLICANMVGTKATQPQLHEYLVPETMTVGDALRRFPEFRDVL